MQVEQNVVTDVVHRLRRVEGQIGGLVKMIEGGRECREVVVQLAAASRALDRVGFRIISSGLAQCAVGSGEQAAIDRGELEKLFLALA